MILHAVRNEMFRTNTLYWKSLNLPREKYKSPGTDALRDWLGCDSQGRYGATVRRGAQHSGASLSADAAKGIDWDE